MSGLGSELNVSNPIKPANKKVEFRHDVINTRLGGLCKVPTWRTGSGSYVPPRDTTGYGYSSWCPIVAFTFLPQEDDAGAPVGRRTFANRTSCFCSVATNYPDI